MKNIAVIIPVKDRKEHLCATLRSLIKSFDVNDICVIENDNVSNCQKICKDYNVNYGFVPIENNNFNKCLSFNIGFLYMNTMKVYDYFLFHDADIVVKSTFKNELLSNLETNPPFIQSYGKKRVLITDEQLGNKILSNDVDVDSLSQSYKGVSLPQPYKSGNYSVGGSIAVKSDVFSDIGGFDHTLFWGYSPEDAYFWEKLKTKHQPTYADEPPIDMFHVWHKSLSQTNKDKDKLDRIYDFFIKSNINYKRNQIEKAVFELVKLNKYFG